MRIREPVVAGQFYPAEPARCRADVERLLCPSSMSPDFAHGALPKSLYGGLVPHAGWGYSGAVAGKVFAALVSARVPDVIVLFGGVHRSRGREAALFADGRWETPLGAATIDARLAERVLGHTNLILDDPYAHESEHSLEVQVPFVIHLFPDAKILPVMVPPGPHAAEVGEAVARTIQVYAYNALVVGTTDLTHYGPHYGLVSHGVGAEANAWAMRQNDRRFVELVCELKSSQVVAEALQYKNACSSGAVAATIAAVAKLGATRGVLLQQTSSSEVTRDRGAREPEDSVGYAGIVFA